jgi:flagellar assembly factor FliW
MATIQTTRFGEVEVDELLIFDFKSPIIGYDHLKRYALIDYKQDSPFKWLQSVENPELAFAVTLCGYFGIDYQFELPDEDVELLGITTAEEVLALNIVTIPHDCPQNATVNLLAPIVINVTNQKAMQTVLRNGNFEIKYPLFENKTKGDDAAKESDATNTAGEDGGKC